VTYFGGLYLNVISTGDIGMPEVSLWLADVVHEVDRIKAIKNGIVVAKMRNVGILSLRVIGTHLPA
jgi:hypothetical protein